MTGPASFRVLGQIEGLSFSELQVWAEGGLVCISIQGPDGKAYATAPPELAQAIAAGIRAAVRQASAQLPIPDHAGEGM